MAEPYLYTYDDETSVEVLVDDESGGHWWPAELRMRTERADGYWYNAAWTRELMTYLDTFHQDRVRRPLGVDVSTEPP